MSGFWLPAAVASLGHLPQTLGIVGDEPKDGRDILLRARRLKLDALILTGGIGSGMGDRTLELLVRTGGQIAFDRVAIQPGGHCLLGETMEMRLLVLGGRPRECAAAFDLIARPALLSALGAAAPYWDWSLRQAPLDTLDPAGCSRDPWSAPPPGGVTWDGPVATALWAALAVRPGEDRTLSVIDDQEMECGYTPWTPEQTGWAILRGPDAEPSGEGQGSRKPPGVFYHAPCDLLLLRP